MMVTLVLLPIVTFNKAMRHDRDKYRYLRWANWGLFTVCIVVGAIGAKQAMHGLQVRKW